MSSEPLQLKIAIVESAPFAENSYIVHRPPSRETLVVDPGLEPEKILHYLDQHSLEPVALLVTHGHGDHIGGLEALRARWPECPIVIGRGDAPKLTDPQLNLSANLGWPIVAPEADLLLEHGERYSAAGLELEVRDTPGHSSGHVVFVLHEHEPKIVFGGDVLFAGSIGRTDFPDGSFEQLADSIRQQLYTLPDETVVLPGHGPTTTVGEERRHNPFVSG